MSNDFGVDPGDYAKLRDEIARLNRAYARLNDDWTDVANKNVTLKIELNKANEKIGKLEKALSEANAKLDFWEGRSDAI